MLCLVILVQDVDDGVDKDDDEGVHEGHNHPDVHHLDVGGLGHGVEHGDEEGGQGHQGGGVDHYDTCANRIKVKSTAYPPVGLELYQQDNS